MVLSAGPGDKLSETQKVWIDVLLSSGTKVEVCRVLTSEEKDRIEGKKGAAAEKAKNGKGKRGRVDG
jgi:Fanconi-associated nuclease 1